VNLKRVRRLYRLAGLQLRMRVRRRKHIALHRGPAPTPTGPTERWSMDSVHDAALEDWAYQRGVQLDFIRPGKPGNFLMGIPPEKVCRRLK
jgi:transposase InsO family protein